MKLIKPYVEIWKQNPGILGIYEQIEKCARVCYKSEDKTGEGTAEKMVEMLKKNEHTAMLEHGTVYLDMSYDCNTFRQEWDRYLENPYSVCHEGEVVYNGVVHEPHMYITTNYRVLVENNWLDDLKYLCEPTEYHEKRITVHFVCDRGVSHELVRHRVFSFAQESTRYCNYSKDKFNKEITFIIPSWIEENKLPERSIISQDDYGSLISEYYYHLTGKSEEYFRPWEISPESNFTVALQMSEALYLELLNQGWQPQQARAVLPNSLKTEVCMTGFMSDWEHFFNLRCDKAAHPQMRELAIPLQEEFLKII